MTSILNINTEHSILIGVHDGIDAVRYRDDCGVLKLTFQHLLQQSLGLGVDVGSGLVDEDNLAPLENSACNAYELALALTDGIGLDGLVEVVLAQAALR